MLPCYYVSMILWSNVTGKGTQGFTLKVLLFKNLYQ